LHATARARAGERVTKSKCRTKARAAELHFVRDLVSLTPLRQPTLARFPEGRETEHRCATLQVTRAGEPWLPLTWERESGGCARRRRGTRRARAGGVPRPSRASRRCASRPLPPRRGPDPARAAASARGATARRPT